MNTFEEDKARKLKRILPLRIMNTLGMIRWEQGKYNDAYQKLRMLHPLSWPWAIAVILVAIIMHGVVEVWPELKTLWRNDCVWW
jgi:hypothetical protein